LTRRAISELLHRHWPLLIPAVFTVSVFHAWLTPGLLLGADWVRRVPDELNNYFPWPHVWNGSQQIGENNDPLISYYPLFALMGLFSLVHVSWNVIERVFFFFPYLVLSVVSPYVFTYRLTRSPAGAAVAASIWTVNTWIVMASERGAIPSIVAASLLPLFFYFAIGFIERATIRRGLGLGLLLTAILIYDLRYVYIAIIFALVLSAEQLIRDRSLRRLRKALLPIGVATVTAVVANLYWILPQFVEVSSAGAGYASLQDYRLNSGYMTPEHALSAFAVFYHWVASDDPFAIAKPEWYFFVIPACVFLSLTANWKRQWVWSLAVGAAIAVLLDSGPSFPVDQINIWIFQHIPGMTLFRDVTKWMSLLFVTYGTIIGFGVARGLAWLRLRRRHWFAFRRWLPAAAAVVVVLAYAIIMNDAYNSTRFRVFSPYKMHDDVLALEAYLQSRPDHARTLVFPRDIEPMRAIDSHPYVEGLQIENSASPDGLRHINLEWDSLYGLFSAPFAPDILREMNIGYVVVPYDYEKVIYSSYISNWTYYDAFQFMNSRRWLKFDRRIGRHYVYRVVDPMLAKAFIAPAPFVMNGDGATLAALVGTPLVSAKTAALLPDQRLDDIWKRIPNYVGGAWEVDTNMYSIPVAQQYVHAGETQAAAARAGRFAFAAAAASTADRRATLYSGDVGLRLDAPFDFPNRGSASFSADLSDISPLNQTIFQTSSFDHRQTTFPLNPDQAAFDVNSVAAATLGKIVYDSQAAGYDATVNLNYANSIPIRGDVSFEGISANGPFSVSIDGEKTTCPGTCLLHNVFLAPGDNSMDVRIAGEPGHQPDLVIPKSVPVSDPRIDVTPVTVQGVEILKAAIPLELRPYMEFNYSPFPPTTTMTMFMRLRSRNTGAELWFATSLPPGGIYDVQLQYIVGDALHERFKRELAHHSGDSAWMFHHRLPEEPDGSGEYEIVAIVIAGPGAAAVIPSQIRFLATPSWPQMATTDVRRSASARYPATPSVEGHRGLAVTQSSLLPGYFVYDLRTVGAAGPRSLTLRLDFPAGSDRNLDFDFYQPPDYVLGFALREMNDLRVTDDGIAAAEGRAYTGGSIVQSDPDSVTWPLGIPHCIPQPCGTGARATAQAGVWKRFFLDLSGIEANWTAAHSLTVTLKYVGTKHIGTERFAISTAAGINSERDHLVPATLVDDRGIRYVHARAMPEIYYTQLRGSLMLSDSREHRIVTVPLFPVRPVSLAISQGTLRTFGTANIRDDRRINDEEYIGTIQSPGGLFVFDESYDPDWTLAIVPAAFKPSGFALVDWIRSRTYEVPFPDHYKVTDIFNGWWIGRGDLRVFALMQLEAYVQLAAIVWLVLTPSWIWLIYATSKREVA
jgi:hypothetical protein